MRKYVVATFRTIREKHKGAWLLIAMLQMCEALVLASLGNGDLDETIQIAAMEFRDETEA